MFSARSIVVTVLAIVCAFSAALGMKASANRTEAPPPPSNTTPIVVAATDLARGQMVPADALEMKEWPNDALPPGAITSIAEASERAALQGIVAGEPVLERKLAERGALGGMSTMIPPGMRAYTIQTQRVATNVAGFLLPGNLVDVLLTFRGSAQDETGGGSTTTLLQAVEVLAVGQRVDATSESTVEIKAADSVTLLVNPEQATRLDLGQSLGMLSLALRNPNDRSEVDALPATVAKIRFSHLGVMTPEPAPEPKAEATVLSAPPPAAPEAPAPAPAPVAVVEAKPRPKQPAVFNLRGNAWSVTRVGAVDKE